MALPPPRASGSTRVVWRPVHRDSDVTPALRIASEWSWRFIVVVAGIALLAYGLSKVSEVLIPVLIAALVAALLGPMVTFAHGRGVPRPVAATVVLLGAIAAVAALITLVGQQVADGFAQLSDQAVEGVAEVERWLADGPLELSNQAVSGYVAQAQDALVANRSTIVSGALGFAVTAGHVVAGFFIALFTAFFFLLDGRRIWSWCLHLLPQAAQEPVDAGARASWLTLIHYMRATIVVALVDGIGVAIGAAILQVPLALPLGVVVFLGAFVPIVGALLAGTVAVLVAFVAHGPVTALLMLGVVILVQQIEGHVLQPFLMGHAVAVHPLAVILAVAAGATLVGVVGALFAVPLVAMANTLVSTIASDGDAPEEVREIERSDAPLAPDKPAPTPVSGEDGSGRDGGAQHGSDRGDGAAAEEGKR
ncbi:putative PurR-regulated permease PerM [Kineococcus xinjiangensis]|uniref:Putative PurR-regulated permease PerM n=1 Tax=Kineococcus xinjiangensis TaxID=512762 RepID=A0A2S6ISH9_9ACTN|nr:AI-2E family transporter [Kineococcus xinjiangensis]PPK97188.1 putative PurR-regulated permease PerM [Kineococcus xinjiangensis]